jgi:hypothetical protein
MTQTTNEAWKKALEQVDLAGWRYEPCTEGGDQCYIYNEESNRIYALVSDKYVLVGVKSGPVLFRRQRTTDDPYFALARAARSAEELAGTYKDIESRLDGKL